MEHEILFCGQLIEGAFLANQFWWVVFRISISRMNSKDW
jgi:hypothetical protein